MILSEPSPHHGLQRCGDATGIHLVVKSLYRAVEKRSHGTVRVKAGKGWRGSILVGPFSTSESDAPPYLVTHPGNRRR
jgi:hypothetical protein